MPHQPRWPGLEGQGDREAQGADHVQPKHLQGCYRQLQAQHGAQQDCHRGAAVHRQHEGQGLVQIEINGPALLHGRFDRGEVVVGQQHVGRFSGHLRAPLAHGDADVGLFEGRGVVDAIAGHGHHSSIGLEGLNQGQLLSGCHPGKHVVAADAVDQLTRAEPGQAAAIDGPQAACLAQA